MECYKRNYGRKFPKTFICSFKTGYQRNSFITFNNFKMVKIRTTIEVFEI